MNNASTTCSRCGKSVPSESRFCLECGSDLTGFSGGGHSNPTGEAATKIDRRAASEQALFETLRHATLGEYDIITEVGRGGMANVYLAHDIALDRKVAIKVISPELLRMGEGVVERFQREARTAASLSHPHIIPIYSVKESDRILFFVMKFVEGRTLESVVREEGQLPVAMVQTILNQVGSALDYAHGRGVIHRDIKPGNIMLDEGGWAVVTDFGIAKVTEADGLTMTGATVGTPTYMSPEQCAGQPLTGAVDQYALGVVAYEMLAGRLPFEGDSAMTVMYKHTHEAPPPIHISWPDCPRPLGNAVMRMLAKDPDDRFPSMMAAIEAIGMADRDDTVRTRMVSLAKSGGNKALLEQFKTPKSSIPRPGAFKTRGTPTNMHTPVVEDSGAQHVSGAGTAVAPTRPRSRLIWGIPALVVLGGIAYVVFAMNGRQTPDLEGPNVPATIATNPPPTASAVADLSVSPTTVSLDQRDTRQLTGVATDSSGTVVAEPVRYSSRDPQIADVSEEGLITALNAGTTTITARAGNHSFAVSVTVSRPPQRTQPTTPVSRPTVADVEVTPGAVAPMRVGQTVSLDVRVLDGSGNEMNSSDLSWRSSNNNVATVSSSGVVSAAGEGTARIIAQVGTYSDEVAITVQPIAVDEISVSPTSNTLDVGEDVPLTARLTDASGNSLTRTVAWSSSNTSVARVNDLGRVTAAAAGSATITASVDGKQATSRVTVNAEPEPAGPTIDPAADRQAITDVIEDYRAALQDENIDALVAIFPDMPAARRDRLVGFFNTVDDLRVRDTAEAISLQGDVATVRVVFNYAFRAAGSSASSDDPQQLTLSRRGNRWIITSIR